MDIFIRNKAYTGPVQAVVLDWAGTAVDHGCIGPVAVFLEVFKRRGVDITPAEARGPMGLQKQDHIRALTQLPEIAKRWQAKLGAAPTEDDVIAMYAETEPLMAGSIANYADPIPGVVETVNEWRRRGIKIGSSTGYMPSMMTDLVATARDKGYHPDSIVCSGDVPAGRPYPWMCYRNAINLQTYPMESMVKIGDTVADIQEGLNAGMWTIGVTKTGNEIGLTETEVNALDPTDLENRIQEVETRFQETGAHFVASSLADCPALIEVIEARLADGERP